MGWIQWQGETWRPTTYEADLRAHIGPADSMSRRISWWLQIAETEWEEIGPDAKPKIERWIDIDIHNLPLHSHDWRDFSGLEIRADATWHAAHETYGEYGHLSTPVADVMLTYLGTKDGPKELRGREHWHGHDWILRFGQRDGYSFPLELDVWLLPRDEYYRKHPETAAELARFGEGPPDLRIMANVQFSRAAIIVPRSEDPAPIARRIARETINLTDFHNPQIRWMPRETRDRKSTESIPGFGSTVSFDTQGSA